MARVTYAWDIYPADDPAGKISGDLEAARLVRLDIDGQLVNGWYKHVGWGVGAGELVIHTDHVDATPANFAKRNYAMFVRTDLDDDVEIGGIIFESGLVDLLSEDDERGGRLLSFKGLGGKFYLDRYRLGHAHYAPGQPHRGDFDVIDYWSWSQEPLGAIYLRGIEEGQFHPDEFFGMITTDFTRTRDSNGNLWDENEDFSIRIMTTILELEDELARQGLLTQVTGSLLFRAFRDIEEFRTDRTSGTFAAGKLRFEKGVNIAGPNMPRRIAASEQRTHVIIRGRDGDYLTIDVDLDDNPIDGVPYMDSIDSDTTANDDTITKIGKQRLTRRDVHTEQATIITPISDDPTDPATLGFYAPMPGGDGWVLDLATVHTGSDQHDFDEAPLEIASIRFHFDEAGNPFAEYELGAQYLPPSRDSFQRQLISAIRQSGLKLCDADQEVEPAEPVGFAVAGNTLTLPDDLPDGAEVGDWLVGQVARDNGTTVPTIPAGITAIGSGGGTSTGGGGSVAYRMWKRQLDAGDMAGATYVFTNGNSLVGAVLRTSSDPEGAFAGDSIDGVGGSGTVFRVPALTIGVVDGTSRVLLMGHHNQADLSAGTLDEATRIAIMSSPRGSDGGVNEHAAWITEPRSTNYAGDSFAVSPSGGWQSHAIEVFGELVRVAGAGRPELVGTSGKAKRCDDTEHYHATGSASPTVDDDEDAGFRPGTLWINDDGEAWIAFDVSAGAADWIAISGGGGGSPIEVKEAGSTIVSDLEALDFGAGFDVTESPAGEANVAIDLLELSDFTAHHTRHEENGADELLVELLGTAETDTSKRLAPDGAGGLAFASGGGGITGIDVKEAGASAATDVQVVDFGAGFDVTESPAGEANVDIDLLELSAFTDHSARHENGGADEISVAGLSGTLADPQPPALTVEEIDGTPTEANVNLLQFPADTLTEPGAGQVRYKPVTSLTFGWDAGAAGTLAVAGLNPIPIPIEANFVIESWTALGIPVADGSASSCTVELWVDDYANYRPTVADKISASAPITFSTTDDKGTDTTLSGWTTSLTNGKTLHVVPTAVGNLRLLSITLKLRRA